MRHQKLSVNKAFKYKEVIGFIAFILLLAYLLFPKFYILKALEHFNIRDNYIERLYLENIVKHHGISDEELEKILTYYIKSYKYKKAKELLEAVKKGNYKLKTLPLIEYYVLKEEYFSTISFPKRMKIRSKMEKYLIDYLNKDPGEKTAIIVYKESQEMNLPKAEALALYRLSDYTPSTSIIKKAIDMAMYFKDKNELNLLIKKIMNLKHQSKDDMILIYNVCAYLNDIDCENRYFKKLKNDKTFAESHYNEIIMYYVKTKDLKGIKDTINLLPVDLKKKAIEQSITYALWNKDYNLAKSLILTYITFSKDPDFINFMIKNSLATADTNFIKEVGNKILKLYEK